MLKFLVLLSLFAAFSSLSVQAGLEDSIVCSTPSKEYTISMSAMVDEETGKTVSEVLVVSDGNEVLSSTFKLKYVSTDFSGTPREIWALKNDTSLGMGHDYIMVTFENGVNQGVGSAVLRLAEGAFIATTKLECRRIY